MLNMSKIFWIKAFISCVLIILAFLQANIFFTYPSKQLNFLMTPEHEIIEIPYRLDFLQPRDYNKLIDLNNFNFIIQNFPCKDNSTVFLLILVLSASEHSINRQIVRETWGRSAPGLKLLFLVGQTNPNLQKGLQKENEEYKDLIQGNFEDSYYNLTYKHVMGLKYATYHCPKAKYVLKTDDDIFVNMPSLLEFVKKELVPKKVQKLLFCTVLSHSRPKRGWRSKWRVSFDQYRNRKYPKFCQGWSILYSPDAVFTLYSKVQRAKYFWLEDVHVTGEMALSTNITHVSFTPLVMDLGRVEYIINTKNRQNVTDYFLFAPYQIKLDYIRKLWSILYGKQSNV